MLEIIRNSALPRLVWALLGLHILNFSINIGDNIPVTQKEDLTINEQESILEFVAEQLLGNQEAFSEYDDIDTEEHSSKKQTTFQFYLSSYFPTSIITFKQIEKEDKILFSFSPSIIEGNTSKINPPPKIS